MESYCSSVSHEMRTPLQSILFFINIIKGLLASGDAIKFKDSETRE